MLKPFLPIFIILFLGFSAMSQTPEQLTGINLGLGTRSSLATCTGKARSGTTTQTLVPSAKTKNKLFLCSGDTMYVSNTGADLSEDPNLSTPAGIGYFFYNCPPSVSGPRWSDVVKDACLRTVTFGTQVSPTTARGDVAGRDTFFNNGSIQNAFNAGKPMRLWFSSATIYDFFKLDAEGDTACVNVGNVASGTPLDTFSVVYLNPVRISNLTYANRAGSFKVEGGLPEYNSSTYTLTITKTTDPSKVGIVTGSLTNGSTLTFTVPEDGSYVIKATDGVSCDASATVAFPTITLTISNEQVKNTGDIACVKVISSAANSVSSLQLYMTYNRAIIKYSGIKNVNPLLTGFTNGNINFANDTLNISWDLQAGINIPANTTLFEVCFNTLGPNLSSSPVRFIEPPGGLRNIMEDVNGSEFKLDTIQGSVKIGLAPVNVRYAVDSTNCNKDSTGRIRIIPTGTGAPFSYAWQSKTSSLLNGVGTMALGDTGKIIKLAAGTYFLTVTDAANSVRNDTLDVKEPSAILANAPFSINTCLDSSRGSLEILAVAGGTAPYSFLWNTGATTKKIINLPQGPYSCTITDAKGCNTRVAGDIIATPIQITGRTLTPAKCTGANIKTGSVAILGVSGGSPPSGNYTFTWNTIPVATQTGATAAITNLDPGLYRVTISDGNCTGKDSFLVAAERTVEVTAAITNVTCNGIGSGTILATASSRGTANPPYVFRWTGINVGDITSAPATSLARNLKAGKYPLTVTDQDGCRAIDSFTITEPSAIKIKVDTLRNESCLTGGDGLIGITASGGTIGVTGYTYQWSRSAADNKPIISNLFAGSYKIEITDGAACIRDTTFTVIVPKKPTLTLAIKDASCFGKQDGSARVIVTPPAGAVVTGITWNNGGVTDIITPVKPDTYRVIVALSNTCLKDTFAVVGSPAPLMIDTVLSSIRNPTCPGYDDGQITLVMKGGTAPYRYVWSGGQPTGLPVFPSLKEGIYKFTIEDFNLSNCPSVETTIALVAPPDIKVSYLDIVGTKCYGKCVLNRSDGKATATAMGGPANTGIYTFLWSSGESTARALELCGGIQTVSVSDGICTKKDTVIIPEPLPFTFSTPVIEEPSCRGLKDGKAQVLLTGGTAPYSYNWTTGSTTNDIVNVTAGTYSVVVTDANQCVASPLSIAINEPQSLKLDTLKDATNDVTCFGFSDGKITLQRTGGNGGATVYTWTNNVSQTNLADKLKAGIYYVTATDRKGCKDSISFTIKQPDKIYYFLETPLSPRCYGELTYIKVDTAFGSTYAFPFTVSVDNGPQYPIKFQVPVFADKHLVTITEQITGCSDTVSVSISQPPPITVRFADIVDSVPIPRILVGLGTEVRLNPIITGALPIDSVLWTPKDYLKTSNEPLRPIIRPLDDKTYKLKVTDVNGCVGIADLLVELERNRNVYIPNVFSPNGDDKNDFFGTFSGVGVKSVNYMRIFDRWGELIFQAENLVPSGDPSAGWDGSFRGKPVATGVYVYIVEVSFEDGAKLLYRGDITVAR